MKRPPARITSNPQRPHYSYVDCTRTGLVKKLQGRRPPWGHFRADGRQFGSYPETGFESLAFYYKWMTILNAAQEAASMPRRKKTTKRPKPKTILRLPDLGQSKNAVCRRMRFSTRSQR